MPIILVVFLVIGLMLPRLTIFLLWLLTNWFAGVFVTWLFPLLDFIFMPCTLLWWSIVANLFSGVWGPVPLIGLLAAVLLDLSSSGFGYRHYHSHYYVVEEWHE